MLGEFLARLRGDTSGGRVATLFPDFPQLFDAPQDVLRSIRDISPDVDLLYMGWGKWYLVRLKPNRLHAESAMRRIREAFRLLGEWEKGPKYKANPGAFRRIYGRYIYWLMVEMGARPIAEYDQTFIRCYGIEAIPDDLRVMEWMLRNTSDTETLRLANYAQEQGQADAKAAFADYHAAKDVCDYLNKRTHGVTRYDDPERRRGRSGFTTVAAIGADGQRRSIA